MTEEKEGSAPQQQPEGSPSKPMSKLEQARAAARQEAEHSEETSEAPEQFPSKPMSKLEQARAASKEKLAEQAGDEQAEASKPKSKLEQLRAAAAGKGAGPSDTTSKLAAARAAGGAKAEKPAAQGATAGAKAPPPPMPKRPAAPAKQPAKAGSERRGFVAGLGAILVTGWGSFGAAWAVALAGTVRFMFPNVLTEPPSKFKIGSPGDYPPESVSTKWKAKFGIWVVNTTYNDQQVVYALRTVCTHLGCTPNWLDTERKFKCPCHGSGFYVTGINFEGPAPRPLERYAIRLAEDGQLEVDKSRLFQQELGQWEDTASYIVS